MTKKKDDEMNKWKEHINIDVSSEVKKKMKNFGLALFPFDFFKGDSPGQVTLSAGYLPIL